MKILPTLLLLSASVLSAGEQQDIFKEKSIKLRITDFYPQFHYFLFTGSYTSPLAVLSTSANTTGLDIRNGNGTSLKDTSISISHHSYEPETGKGKFSLGILVKDRSFPQDGRIHIRGKLPVECSRLASLPEMEINLLPNAAYSIPLFIPTFLGEGTDVADLEKCPHLAIRLHPQDKSNTWSIGLTYPVNFPYVDMGFFDLQGRRIPAKIEMAGCRSGPREFHPFTCTFPEKYDRVRLVIQYSERREIRNLPIRINVTREDAMKAMHLPPGN